MKTQLKKRLSLFLALLMLISMGSMMDWRQTFLPEASAATAGNYSVVVRMNVNDSDSESDGLWVKVWGKNNNGTGSETLIGQYYFDGRSQTVQDTPVSTPYFPTRFESYWWANNIDEADFQSYTSIFVNGSEIMGPTYMHEERDKSTGKDDYSCSCSGSYSGAMPYANSISITGGADQTIYADYNATATSGNITATVYDNWGVAWYQSPEQWSTTGDTLSSTGSVDSVKLSSSTHSDHSRTVTAKFGSYTASTTVTFKWKHKVTVTNTGSGTSGDKYDYSGNTLALNPGTKTGYTFSSWTKSGTGTLNGSTWTYGNGDGAVTANWTKDTYTLSYTLNGGNATNPATYQVDTATFTLNNPTKAGYTFTGWSGTGLSGSANTSVSVAQGSTGNRSYTAHYSPIGYTITYNADGGAAVSSTSYNIESTGTLPSTTKAGYQFNGWAPTSNGGNWTGSSYAGGSSLTGMYGNVTLKAQWLKNDYKVHFNANGGTGTMSDQNFKYGESQNLSTNAFTRVYTVNYDAAGGSVTTTSANTTATYTFAGWATSDTGSVAYSDGQSVSNLTTTQNGTVNLYAKWNSASVTLPTPSRQGYSFAGWYNGATQVSSPYTPTANVTLTAHWDEHTYNFVYYGNKPSNANTSNSVQSVPGNTVKTYSEDVNLTSSTPTLTGWTFVKWTTNADGTGTAFTAGALVDNDNLYPGTNGGNVPLYAQWQETTYTITFNANSGNAVSAIQYNINGNQTLPSTTRTGYTFNGWEVTANGGNWSAASYTSGTSVNGKYGNVTLKAIWNANNFDVIFNGNGGTGSMSNQQFTSGQAQNLTANTFSRSHTVTYNYNNATGGNSVPSATVNYTFDGWSLSAGSASTSGDTTTIGGALEYANQGSLNLARDASLTLYARWKTTTNYVTLPTPTRNGYTFDGWWTNSDCTGTRYNGGAKYQPVTANAQLYAKWDINTYTVTYTDSVSINEDASGTLTYKITDSSVLKVPAKTGYDFAGWKCTATSGSSATETATSWTVNTVYGANGAAVTLNGKYGNVTLEAQWTPHTYKFVYNGNKPATANGYSVNASNNVAMNGLTYTTKTYAANTNISSTEPSLEGWTFAGWTTSPDGTGAAFGAGAALNNDNLYPGKDGSVQLYAKWTQNSYTVKYHSSLKTGGSMSDQGFAYEEEKALSANGFTRSYGVTFNENYTGAPTHSAQTVNYAIKGWSTDDHEATRDGATNYANAQAVKKLVAANGGTLDLYIVWKDGGITLENYTRDGYKLEGWYTGVSGSTYTGRVGSPGDTYYPTENKTLYARWVEHKYTVNYNANSATSGAAPASQADKPYFTAFNLQTNTGSLARTGYTLTGWNTSPDGVGHGTHYDLGQSVSKLTNNESITLYAEWTANKYNVTFHMNDGGTVTAVVEQTYDSPWVNVPNNWTRYGYTLKGWYTDAECTEGNKVTVTGNYTHDGAWDLYAKWEGLTYNVVYNKNTDATVSGMPSPATVTKTFGTAVTLPAAPSRIGYSFEGWDLNGAAAAGAYNAGASFNADPSDIVQDGTLNIYAIWKPVTYTVRYNANTPAATENAVSNVPGDQTKTYDAALTLSSTEPGLVGYTFNGWNTQADGNGTAYAKGASMTTDHANTQNAVVLLYAQWTPIAYTVSFNGNGATGTAAQPSGGTMADQSFDYDEEKSLTANTYQRKYTVTYNYHEATGGNGTASTVVSYVFAGWNTYAIAVDAAAAAEYSDAHLVKNLRSTAGVYQLYAKWTSASATLPTPTRNGYTFNGWYEDASYNTFVGNGGDAYTPAGNITLHAKWTANRYTITYTDSLASVQPSAAGTANYYITAETTDGAVTALKEPSKTGYDFAGWKCTNAAGSWTLNTVYEAGASVEDMYGNVTLQAQWTAHTYTVHYDGNLPSDSNGDLTSGTTTVPADQTKVYGTLLTLSDAVPTLTGYEFTGWSTTPTGAAAYQPAGSMDDAHYTSDGCTVTLYAVWSANSYTVHFNGNGDTAGAMANQSFVYDVWQALSPNGFSRVYTVTYDPNYDGGVSTGANAEATFIGWADSADGAKVYDPGETVKNLAASGTKELYAKWTLGSVTLPLPVRTGWTFGGWYTDSGCTDPVGMNDEDYTPTGNIRLFAKWTANTYTITYNANTDDTTVSGIPANQTKTYATALTLDSGVPTRDGYTFLHWNTAQDGNGTTWTPGASLNVDYATETGDTVTLYAIWQANTYVITYLPNGATSGGTTGLTVRYDQLGSSVVYAANGFIYPGYTFEYWKESASESDTTQYAVGAPVSADLLVRKGVLNASTGNYELSLYAKWKQNVSTVRIDHGNGDAIIEVTQVSGTNYNVSGDFSRTGYTFNGWTLTKEGGGAANGSVNDLSAQAPVYTFGNENFVTDILTAQWSKNPYTIVYHYNVPDAPENEKSVTVYYDTAFTFAPADYFGYRLGYEIDGWATSADGAMVYDCGASSADYTPSNLATGALGDDEVHLYAVWTAKQYNVTFYTNTGFSFAGGATSQTKTITFGGSQTFTVVLETGYTQATGRDPAAYVDSGEGAVPDGTKSGTSITFTVTNYGESDLVIRTQPLPLNTYTVTLVSANGSFNAAADGYNRPTVQSTVTHGDDVSFDLTLLDGFHLDDPSAIISATVGGTSVTPSVSGTYTYTVADATGNVVITLGSALKNGSTVIFRGNGGTWYDAENDAYVETQTAGGVYGGASYTVAAPARDGYTFAGWSRITSGDYASTANGSLNGNTYTFGTSLGTDQYEAQWTANTYTVTFSQETAAGDPAWAVITKGTLSKSAVYGGAMPAIDNLPTRVGYDFMGYTVTDGGTDYRYNASGAVVGENVYGTAGDTTLYAKWEPHVYSISLDGTPVGYTVTYPPSKGYNENYTFTIEPEAGYDVNAINVSVSGNGGYTTSVSGGVMTVSVTGVNADNVISVSGALLTYTVSANLVNPEAFAGYPASVTVNYNTSGVTVEVTMANGYQDAAPAVEVVSSQTGLTASVTRKSGTDATYVIALSGAITADVTLNLTGEENTYTVTLNGSEVGYALPSVNTGSIEYLGSSEFIITLEDAYTQTSASDITWTGVNGSATLEKISDNRIKVTVTSTEPGDVTVTLGNAKENVYTLTFVNNGGVTFTVNEPVPATVSTIGYSDTFTFNITLSDGYTGATPVLDCDNDGVTSITASKNGSVVTYTVKDYFTGNTTLTLNPAAPNQSTLTVDLDGGTLAGIESSYTGAYGDTLTFAKPTKAGYTFAGWVLGGDDNGTLAGASSASATYTFGPASGAADTLTATYTANRYRITYYRNYGSNAYSSAYAYFGDEWPTPPEFGYGGYTFIGWFTDPVDETTEFTIPATYEIVGNTVLYAHWQVNTSTLKVNPNGGKVTVDTTEYNNVTCEITKAYGETATVYTPTKTGYTFNGWTRSGVNGTMTEGDGCSVYAFGKNLNAVDTFTAKWVANTYTVTFVKNDGTGEQTEKTVTYNAAWPAAPTVTRTGWTFAGWHTAAEADSPFTFPATYTTDGDTVLYAHWTKNSSTVVFDPAEGTITLDGSTYTHASPYTSTKEYGETVSAPTPERTGYTFSGWTRSSGSNGTLEGGVYTFGSADGVTDTFVPEWAAKTYTVKYMKNDGTSAYETATATFDAAWPAAPVFSRTGYDPADGWYTEAEGGSLVDMSGTFTGTENVTVYKHWTAHTSKVTVALAGGSGATAGDYTQAYGTTLTLSEPTRTGYTFAGWTLSSGANGTLSGNTYTFGPSAGTADTVTAQWTANTYTVKYMKNDGTGAYETATATYNAAWPADPTFERTGYDAVDGWYTEGTNGSLVDMSGVFTGTGDVIVFKHWTVHTGTLTVDLDGGTLAGVQSSYTGAYGSTLTFAKPTKPGYTFDTWVLGGDQSGMLTGASSASATYTFGAADGAADTLTATYTPNRYRITYYRNYGSNAYSSAYAYFGDEWPTPPEFGYGGYTFIGWFTDPVDETTEFTIPATYEIVGNTVLYAHWQVNTSTLKVNPNGGKVTVDTAEYDNVTCEITKAYGETATVYVPTRTGYTFNGWTRSGVNGTMTEGEGYSVYAFGKNLNAVDTFTAKWIVNTYTVTFVKNDGTGEQTEKTVKYNAAWPAAPTVTRTGWTFDGWYTAAVNGDPFTFPATYTTDGDTVLYAHWTKNSSTVRFDPNGGEITVGSNTYTTASPYEVTNTYGESMNAPTPAREGYTFNGWTRTSGSNGTFEGGVYTFGPTKDALDVLTADWTIKSYTVTLESGVGYTVEAGPQSPVDWNGDSYVTIRLTDAYSDSDAPAATVNGVALPATDNGDGTFTYTVTGIKEAKTIVIGDADMNTYTVEVSAASGAKGILSVAPAAAVTVNYGEGTTITVTLADGYSASDAPAVTKVSGAAVISGGVKSTADGKTVYTYTVSNVTADTEYEVASATPNTYTVYYYRNDGTDAYVTRTATFDAAWPAAPTFTRTGWTKADGWFTGPANGDPAYTFTDTYVTVGDTEVYAHWTVNRSSLTVDPNGGSVTVGGAAYTVAHTFEQDYNTTLTVSEPTREGWHFTGWTKSVTNGSFVGDTYTFGATAGAEDTLTANWEIDTFTVTLETGVGYTVEAGPQSPVDWDGDSYVTIRLSTGYVNSPAPEAYVNGAPLAALNNGDGTFTYTVTGIKENKSIVIGNATRDNCSVTAVKASGAVGIESFTPASAVSVEYATGVTYITVTLEAGYSDSAAPAVTRTAGAATISAGTKSTVGGKTVYTYTVSEVTEDSTFTIGSATINRYDLALIVDGTGYVVTQNPAGTDVVAHGGSATVKVTMMDGYSESAAPAVSLVSGAATISAGVRSTVDGKTVYTYTVSNVTADSVLNIGAADINTYDVALVAPGPGYTVTQNPTGTDVVAYGGSVVVKLTLNEAYTNSAFPTITVKNAANEDIGTAIPSKNGSEITYTVYGITDDVTVTIGAAQINTYVITIQTGEGAQVKNADTDTLYVPGDTITVTHGTEFRFRLADPTLTTPVYVNGVAAVPNADGVFTVTVTQNTVISTNKLEYIAIFQNYDGSIVEKHIIIRGGAAYCNTVPEKPSTDHHDYVFAGWLCTDPAGDWVVGENMLNMTEDRVFVAVYTTYHKNLSLTNDGTNHWWYCTECDYTEGLAAHVSGGIKVENLVTASCTVQGSHDEAVYCAICNYEMSRTTVTDGYDYTNHTTTQTYSEVLYEATCTTAGMKVFYCANCDHVVRYEEIPVNPANHYWNTWVDNGDGTHSRGCAYCGDANKQTKPHSLREIYRSAATCVSDGVIVSYCPDCATVVTKTLEATGVHTPGDVCWLNYTAATCTEEGGYDAVRYCTVCGQEISNTHVTLEATGIHRYEITYSPEDATCTQTDPITKTYTCKDCGETHTEILTPPGYHTVKEWTITKTPTENDPVGSRTGVCAYCGETVTEEIYFTPLGQKFVQFITTDGVVFTYIPYEQDEDGAWGYNPAHEARVKGTVTYYSNVTMKFFVTVNSSFPYSDYDVYLNRVKMTQNADGSYSIPASADSVTVQVIGTTPTAVNPGDSGTEQGNNGKLSFWQRIVNFFKSISDFFRNLFSR